MELGASADVRRQRAHVVDEPLGRSFEVQSPIVGTYLGRVRRLALLFAVWRTGIGQDAVEEAAATSDALAAIAARVVVRLDREPLLCRRSGRIERLTSLMIETPVSRSPAINARSIGAAPRHRGRSDGWTLATGARRGPARGR